MNVCANWLVSIFLKKLLLTIWFRFLTQHFQLSYKVLKFHLTTFLFVLHYVDFVSHARMKKCSGTSRRAIVCDQSSAICFAFRVKAKLIEIGFDVLVENSFQRVDMFQRSFDDLLVGNFWIWHTVHAHENRFVIDALFSSRSDAKRRDLTLSLLLIVTKPRQLWFACRTVTAFSLDFNRSFFWIWRARVCFDLTV